MAKYHTTEQLQKIEHWLNSLAFPLERLERLEENCPIIPVYIGVDFSLFRKGVLIWDYNPITESILIKIFTQKDSYHKTFSCGRWVAVATISALQAFFQQYYIIYADGVLNG